MVFTDCVVEQTCFKNFRKIIHKFNLTTKTGLLPHIFLVAGIFLLMASLVTAQPQNPEEDSDLYEFGAGDVMEVLVFGEPEISKTVFVRSDGRISLPLAGEFMAAGQTPETLAKKISEKLIKVVDTPNVTVVLTENNSKVYYVLGQVAAPGQYAINRPITVLQAISRAGGFLEWAKKSKIMIAGGPQSSKKTTYFNYNDFLKGDSVEQNIVIQPEDTIVVP